MVEKFDSKFHKDYVRGAGEIVPPAEVKIPEIIVIKRSFEEVLAEYRRYVRDPNAELPEDILKTL